MKIDKTEESTALQEVELINEDENKIIDRDDNTIKASDFFVEINILESPIFSFGRKKTMKKATELLKNEEVSKEAKEILNSLTKSAKEMECEYIRWDDSKGLNRELLALAPMGMPNDFAMDVFIGLVGLFVIKNSPVVKKEKVWDFQNASVEFTFYELCNFINIPINGENYKKIRKAIRQLTNTQYYSLGNGSVYNKKGDKYEIKGEKAISLLGDVDFTYFREQENKPNKKLERGNAYFGDLIMENIKHGFIRFLKQGKYFTLKTGLTRRLYLYLESNKYDKKKERIYIKRNFSTLKTKIPINYTYNSELKRKINKALENLIVSGTIKGYFYGDEVKINGIKEECIYIYFKGTQAQLIKSLTKEPEVKITKKDKETEELQEDSGLVFPENIQQELEDIGISTEMIPLLLKKYSKYKLAEHLLWLQEKNKNKKANSLAGLFMFSLKTENIVKKEFPHITKFIEEYRNKTENKNMDVSDIENIFRKYNDDKLEEFKKEDEAGYEMAVEMTLDLMEDSYKDKIKRMSANLINYSGEELDKKVAEIDRWELFGTEKEKSEVFKEVLIEQIRLYKLFDGFFSFNDFKQKYANGLIKTS